MYEYEDLTLTLTLTLDNLLKINLFLLLSYSVLFSKNKKEKRFKESVLIE